MKQQLLLLKDVDNLGKSGEIVTVKSGYARNFLMPQKMAIRAGKETVRIQQKLQQERKEQAALDRKESEELAKKLANITLKKEVKTDPDGKMYGSVGIADILELLKDEAIILEKSSIKLAKPLKEVGMHSVVIHLKEEVKAFIAVNITPEGVLDAVVDSVEIKESENEELNPTEQMLESNEKKEWTHQEKNEMNQGI